MEGIISAVTNQLGGIAFGLAIPLVFILAKKWIPKSVAKYVAKYLGEGFGKIDELEDPNERQLVYNIALAVVKWAEYKIPDPGQGELKYDIAAEKLCSILPFLKGREDDIEALIEASVKAMDLELKKYDK